MDKPADPAPPFDEVYQAFLADLANEGLNRSTIHRYRYNIVRFEKWLVATGQPNYLLPLTCPDTFATQGEKHVLT
jgi:hypothetical protein